MKQNETPLDPFAEIAFREHPLHKEGMAEAEPIAYRKRYFAEGSESVERLTEPDWAKRLADHYRELAALREVYRPYLRELAPAAPFVRNAMELGTFDFRYHSPQQDIPFARVLTGEGEWERVTIPDYRGPTKENGRWTGYYRTRFAYPKVGKGRRAYLVFKGVDYKAAVYVNHKWVGGHEGFFAPFACDITDVLEDDNVLVVEVRNDYPMMGVDGTRLDGDKMYAATGPGWDDPLDGWHHCPPGAGIYNNVFVEERAELHIEDVFVRPDIANGSFEAWIDVMNATDRVIDNIDLHLDVFARNFAGDGLRDIRFRVAYAGPGMNYYRFQVSFPQFRLWEPERPHLYTLRAGLLRDGEWHDCRDRSFGMRTFRMDEASLPKGTLLLNERPVILRGANEMGHLQLNVMRGDEAQLIDDILIAKLANLNMYRITQRPVQEEIYDCMDRLGMMVQCDLPAFSYIRRNQFCEAVRQAAEMERLVRGHPSVVIASLINEPSRPAKRGKGHRHLYRDELEAFFTAARQAIMIENPDRVVKHADGDYDPPTATGLSDFHCYTMWYTNHAIPFGRLYKGFLPPLAQGWKTGCGEYGAEGLDHLDLMRSRYPQQWLPARPDDPWMPDAIVAAQTYGLHGDWYPEQCRIADWIRESQRYQALVVRLMTDAIRRRSDLIVSSAIHLLIDAWPAGWMKAIVGVDRVPKPAYFAYRESLAPVRVHLRCDRWRAYAGEVVEVEAWLLNDRACDYRNCKVRITFRSETDDIATYEITADAEKTMPTYAGTVRLRMPVVADRAMLYADACMLDDTGAVLNAERFEIEAFATAEQAAPDVAFLGVEAEALCAALGLRSRAYAEGGDSFAAIVISSKAQFREHEAAIVARIREGGRAILLADEEGEEHWEVGGFEVRSAAMPPLYALMRSVEDSRLSRARDGDFAFCYNRLNDCIDAIADRYLEAESLAPMLYTYRKPLRSEPSRDGKQKRAVVGSAKLGDGELVFVRLLLNGTIGCNPPLDRLMRAVIHPA